MKVIIDPAALERVVAEAITPAMNYLPRRMDSTAARVMLLAIGLQESRFLHRWQLLNSGGKGPARGYFQMEKGGGVRAVMVDGRVSAYTHDICKARDVEFEAEAIWLALERDDVLAAATARLYLWLDPKPLPEVGDADAAWDCYLRQWRPGKPHPHTWPDCYRAARNFVASPA